MPSLVQCEMRNFRSAKLCETFRTAYVDAPKEAAKRLQPNSLQSCAMPVLNSDGDCLECPLPSCRYSNKRADLVRMHIRDYQRRHRTHFFPEHARTWISEAEWQDLQAKVSEGKEVRRKHIKVAMLRYKAKRPGPRQPDSTGSDAAQQATCHGAVADDAGPKEPIAAGEDRNRTPTEDTTFAVQVIV